MKKILLISLLLLTVFAISGFSYAHVFTWQDFEDTSTGIYRGKYFESNDDGTHGYNDKWGPNNEYTWPDEPGDTNIYLKYDKRPLIVEENGNKILYIQTEKGKNGYIFFKNLPTNPKKTIEVKYEFFIDNPEKLKNSKIMLFSNGSKDNKNLFYALYEDGRIKIYQGRNCILDKTKKIENRWFSFKVRIFAKECFFYLNNVLLCEAKTPVKIDLPEAYIGLKQSAKESDILNFYLDNLCVWHRE